MGAIKVLVVDDEAEIVELLKDWLEMEGYEVSGTTDSKEDLGIFSRTNPDVSIVDLRMPGMDGFQLISAMRRESDAPIILMSALADDESVIKGIQVGADDYLTKPIARRYFLTRVAGVLRRSRRALQKDGSCLDKAYSAKG